MFAITQFSAVVNMPSTEFKESVMRLSDAGDDCRIIIQNNRLKMVAQVKYQKKHIKCNLLIRTSFCVYAQSSTTQSTQRQQHLSRQRTASQKHTTCGNIIV
jgi:hypothetical protein